MHLGAHTSFAGPRNSHGAPCELDRKMMSRPHLGSVRMETPISRTSRSTSRRWGRFRQSARPKDGPRLSPCAYLQSDRAASSATTTQLGCSCRMDAGQEGWMGPKHMSCTAWAFFSPLATTSTM